MEIISASHFTFNGFQVQSAKSPISFNFSLFTFFIAFALCILMPLTAHAADKLIVKDTGGNTKFVVTDTGLMGINTATPSSQIEAAIDGGLNSDVKLKVASSGGGVPTFYGVRAGGSLLSPSATPAGKGLFWLGAMGYGSSGWTSALTGLIGFWSTETWTATANGTEMRFFTTASGTAARAERVRISDSGNVGIGTTAPTQLLDINSDGLRVRNPKTPASSGDACNQGEMAWDANYIYVCVATNIWKRATLSSW